MLGDRLTRLGPGKGTYDHLERRPLGVTCKVIGEDPYVERPGIARHSEDLP